MSGRLDICPTCQGMIRTTETERGWSGWCCECNRGVLFMSEQWKAHLGDPENFPVWIIRHGYSNYEYLSEESYTTAREAFAKDGYILVDEDERTTRTHYGGKIDMDWYGPDYFLSTADGDRRLKFRCKHDYDKWVDENPAYPLTPISVREQENGRKLVTIRIEEAERVILRIGSQTRTFPNTMTMDEWADEHHVEPVYQGRTPLHGYNALLYEVVQ